MTVRIPITADASQAASAFEKIRAAIRKTGQEGRAFADLDFSHPELKDLAGELGAVQQKFHDIQKHGIGRTAGQLRSGSYRDVLQWYTEAPSRFTDRQERDRHMRNVLQHIAPAGRVPAPPSPGGGGGGRGHRDDASGWTAPRLNIGGLLRTLLPLAGIGGAAALAGKAVEGAASEDIGVDTLKRKLGDLGVNFDDLRQHLEAASAGLGVTYQETVKLATQFAKISNARPGDRLAASVRTGIGLARGLGLDPDVTNQYLAQGRWLGVAHKGDADSKQLALTFAEAISASGMWSRADEVMGAITRWVQSSERVMVHAPDVTRYAGMYAAMNRSGMPGLRGEAGEALMAQIDAAIRHGGAFGEAGQNFMWRALAKGGPIDPFQMEFLHEGGMFGSRHSEFGALPGKYRRFLPANVNDRTTNLQYITETFGQMFHNPFQKWDAMKNVLGLNSLHQAMALDNLAPVQLGSVQHLLARNHIQFRDVNATGIAMLARVATAGGGELGRLRDDFLRRPDLSDADRGALASAHGEGLRDVLTKIASKYDQESTEGTKTRASIADLQNALTASGQHLLGVLNVVRDTATGILTTVNNIFAFMSGGKNPGQIPAPAGGWTSPDGRASIAAMHTAKLATLSPALMARAASLERQYHLPAGTLQTYASIESSGNPRAVSTQGAIGLMQVMPATAAQYGYKATDLYSPEKSLDVAAKHLAHLNRVFGGNQNLVAAAYNAGEGAVQRAGNRIPNIAETRDYVLKYNQVMPQARRANVSRAMSAMMPTRSNPDGWLPGQGTPMPETPAGVSASPGMDINLHVTGTLHDQRGKPVGKLEAPSTRVRAPLPAGVKH